MARRRGHGEGSISQRADGRWMGRVTLGRGSDGRRQRKTIYGHSESDVVREMKKVNGRAVNGLVRTTSTPTVSTFLDLWFDTKCDEWRPSTRRGYRAAIDRFLTPAFGPLRLEQLGPLMIQHWLTSQKKDHGARRRIALAHAVLRSALTAAKGWELVATNAAESATPPAPTPRAITALDVDQARTFLAVAEGHRLSALFAVALACGLRLGEATGLRWDDVDLATGELRIRQQLQRIGKQLVLQPLKTEKSRRTLALPQVCLEGLKAHRTQQLQDRLKAGQDWIDTGLVFTSFARRGAGRKVGTGLQPRNVLRTFHELLVKAKLPRVRFHDLRHSAASLLIAKGVELVEVSMLLGHSELRVTADLYSHLQKQTAAKAAKHMDAVFAAKP